MSRRHPDDVRLYSLDELASEADVTPRTIRYYIAEGLLPPPDSPGRNARYSQEHLDRLRLIAEMKSRYLPLKEIRRAITAIPPEQIQRRGSRTMERGAASSPPALEPSPAHDYVAHVLRESAASYPAREGGSSRRNRQALDATRPWRRVPITDDAELLITEDAWRRRGEQIDTALDWLRRILNE